MSKAERTWQDRRQCSYYKTLNPDEVMSRRTINKLTFSCLKKHSILSSRKTLLEDTREWKTFGSFLRATRRPSRGSVTALQHKTQV